MEILEIFGYIGAVFIGITLGLIGGGGSILTVPVMVYLFGVTPVLATAYSLFIVGFTALIGAVQNLKKGMVDIKTGIVFSIPAFIAVYSTRKFIVPAIPEELFTLGDFTMTKSIGIMVFFAIIMFLAAFAMIRNKCVGDDCKDGEEIPVFNYPMIVLEGIVVGVLTGLVGAGGGFLIIPALVLLAKLPMKKAVATSLLIIAVKSLIGFIGDVENLTIDWSFLGVISALSVIGIFIGVALSKVIDGDKLKRAFGWFVLVMALYIIFKELIA